MRQSCTRGHQNYIYVHKETVKSTPGMCHHVCGNQWSAVNNVIGAIIAWMVG